MKKRIVVNFLKYAAVQLSSRKLGMLLFPVFIFTGCTNVTIDETRHAVSELNGTESIVIIGRRNGNDYETEPDLVECVGKSLQKGNKTLNVVPEEEFVDRLYPWFEPRTAPARAKDLYRLLKFKRIAEVIDEFNVHYFVWIDGSTQTTSSSGQINCGITPAGVSCFGFGTWDQKAEYEATIWNYKERTQIGKISSEADGTSYLPAIVIPIPIIAPVQGDACKAMGTQLRTFFGLDSDNPNSSGNLGKTGEL